MAHSAVHTIHKTITTRPGASGILRRNYAILVTFDDVSLESGCCRCDFVYVRETINGTTVHIGSVCDMTTPQLNSTGNNVTVIFRSDDTLSGKGFRARYQAIKIRGKSKKSLNI